MNTAALMIRAAFATVAADVRSASVAGGFVDAETLAGSLENVDWPHLSQLDDSALCEIGGHNYYDISDKEQRCATCGDGYKYR